MVRTRKLGGERWFWVCEKKRPREEREVRTWAVRSIGSGRPGTSTSRNRRPRARPAPREFGQNTLKCKHPKTKKIFFFFGRPIRNGTGQSTPTKRAGWYRAGKYVRNGPKIMSKCRTCDVLSQRTTSWATAVWTVLDDGHTEERRGRGERTGEYQACMGSTKHAWARGRAGSGGGKVNG